MCDLFWEGGGKKSHRWGTFTIWHFIRGKEIHGGGVPCDTGFALFWQHDVSPQKNQFHTSIINHISLEICLHVSLPVNLHITSACKRVVSPVLNDWMRNRKAQIQSHSRRRYTRCALGRLHFAHRRAEVRRSRITPDYFEDKRALIFSRRRRRDRAHSRARGCFEHMDFPEMCKLKCCESALVKIATKLRKQRAN